MTTPTEDRVLDEYLSGKSQVSQHYRGLEADDVPAHLDDRILAQARAAVAAPVDELAGVREKRRRLMRWSIPAALAASALLVVSIVIRTGPQQEGFGLAPRGAPQPARQMAQPQAATESENSVVLITPPRDATTESPVLGLPSVSSQTRKQQAEQAQANSITAHAERAREAIYDEPLAITAPAPAAAPAEVPLAPPPAPALAREDDEDEYVARADRASADQQLAATAQEQRSDAAARQSVAASAGQEFKRAQPAAAAHTPASAISADALARELNPDAWLEHIRQLRRDGKSEDADQQWRAFREKYPDHIVSETDLARSKP